MQFSPGVKSNGPPFLDAIETVTLSWSQRPMWVYLVAHFRSVSNTTVAFQLERGIDDLSCHY